MRPEALERPKIVGPRNETAEEAVGLLGEAADRPLWRASDDEKDASSGESRDEEHLSPLGESRDDKKIAHLGESRDKDQDNLRQGQKEEKEKEVTRPSLMLLAASSIAMLSQAPARPGDVSSFPTATTKTQAPVTSFLLLASTPSKISRERPRDSEDNLKDEESSSQLKRMRMDAILGISRTATKAAKVPQNIGSAMTPGTQQSGKRTRESEDDAKGDESLPQKQNRMDDILGINRNKFDTAEAPNEIEAAMTSNTKQSRKCARSLDVDGFGDGATKSTRKRLRHYKATKEIPRAEEECFTDGQAGVANNDDSTLVFQDSSSNNVHEATLLEQAPTDTKVCKQPSVKEEPPTSDEAGERDVASVDDKAAPTKTVWDTAHGINSSGANIRVPGKGVYTVTGVWRTLYLPTSTGSPDRAWTDQEKEDLRVYIQDYGIEDWAPLSQSTNRPKEELQYIYFEVVTARNIRAGRPEDAAIPEGYPDFPPPPAPVEPGMVYK